VQLADEFNELLKIRFQKLEELRNMGVEPYPYEYLRNQNAAQIITDYESLEGKSVAIAGRIVGMRRMGRASFANIADMSGKIQIYVREDKVGKDAYDMFHLLDIGDLVGLTGEVFKTRTGEITVLGTEVKLLSKSLRPLPVVKEKIEADQHIVYDKFADLETRYRKRYIDLVVNPDVREIFVKRSRIIQAMRNYLNQQGFLEVETPILQPIYGGAFARPFVTHHNTLNYDLYLRISNELYLKRLIVGGFDGVYEFGKDFRNEGMDRFHNPEFTQMELYVAYQDYFYMMNLVETMISQVAQEVAGCTQITFQNTTVNLQPPWRRVRMFDVIEEKTNRNLYGKSEAEIREIGKQLDVDVNKLPNKGKIIEEIFTMFVEPHLVDPTFVIDYPIEISPLAKKHRQDANLVERFEPYIFGREIGNAFSELNDPLDQRKRFEAQMELKKKGDDEAQVLDEDFLLALEYGMPPTAGLGIGIDRLVMMLTNSPSIQDVIFFPQMRPEHVHPDYGLEEE